MSKPDTAPPPEGTLNVARTALLEKAKNVIATEAAALTATAAGLDAAFVTVLEAVEATVLARRKLIFTGVGKNAFIGQKLAATFNSTGVPACTLDPVQALHGDLGLCSEGDLVFCLSNSGETEELHMLLPGIKRLGARTVAMTARTDSILARDCDLTLPYSVPEEACPLRLAPTASTAAAMALGDALAMVYLEMRGFSREDFARLHPAGTLGKSLLLRVADIMRTGERLALAADTVPVQEAILRMTKAKCGILAATDGKTGRLSGVFSDGDFRRLALEGGDFLQKPVAAVMTREPRTIGPGELAVEALRLFEQHAFNDLIVVDEGGLPVGHIDGQDLPKLKLV